MDFCPKDNVMNVCRTPPSPIPYGIRGFAERPPMDPTKGLATGMLTEKDLKSYRYLMETEGSRKANIEDYNIQAMKNRRESKFGIPAPFNGMTLDGVVDYTLSSFIPLYMTYGPACFYLILIFVTWAVTWHIIEGLLTSCIAYQHYGCSPMILASFAGKLVYLPALPFVAAFRHSHVRERVTELLGKKEPPPEYDAAEAVRDPVPGFTRNTGCRVVEITDVSAPIATPSEADTISPLDPPELVDMTYFDPAMIEAHWARIIKAQADMVKVQTNVESMLRQIDEKSSQNEAAPQE